MIDIKNLTVSVGQDKVLDSVSYKLRPGNVYGLICSPDVRSVIFDVLTGCRLPDSGKILVNGDDIFKSPKKAKTQIGYLPEKPPLFGDLTVSEYLTFIAEIKRLPGGKIPPQIRRVTELCEIDGLANVLCGTLSEKDALRVGFAQAIIGRPDTVFVNADVGSLASILSECETAVIAFQNISEASKYCNIVLTVSEGALTDAGFDSAESLNTDGEDLQ